MRREDELVFTSDCGSGYTAVVSLCFQVDVTDMHYDGTRKILDKVVWSFIMVHWIWYEE